ncbi:PH domain-containing protein [Halogeometricum borinquense]|uniref:PH domain-containing protein n=1 Tax=Halogeometricum borinquense TaxID=60847 RepID=A0A6C0UFK7_9EURY|nr:PH domain-containing protein [Halogeometricum borinquense]QIB74165.1 PH domain-containing protein [Halogeometricum borinquense]QIQ76627.1 PH domain-containing protein [Halogeometricum borinquense]
MEPELDWLTLDDDEEIVWSDTPHGASIVPALIVGVPLSFVLIGIPIVVSAYLSLRNTHYVVTTAGLYRKSGILSRDVQKVGFDKVQNTSYSQGILGSSVGFGNVDISTAGGSGVEMRFQSVENPRDVAELVNRHVKQSTGGRDDAGDKEAVLDEVLTELREIRTLLERDESSALDTTRTAGESEQVEMNTIDELVSERPDDEENEAEKPDASSTDETGSSDRNDEANASDSGDETDSADDNKETGWTTDDDTDPLEFDR